MKKVEAIVRPGKFEMIKDALLKEGVSEIAVSNVMGRGEQKGCGYLYRGQELDIEFHPKIKLELVTGDEKLEEVLKIITKIGKTGQIGDGKIFVYPVGESLG